MSTLSHKGQILPLNNQLIPISKNTTFHASYDGSLVGFNQGKRLSPSGYERSLYFNGVDTYIPINAVCALMTTTSLTIEAWVKPITGPTTNLIIVGFYESGGANRNMLCYNPTLKKFNYYDESLLNIYGNTEVTNGSWYHIAITIDSSNNLRMYLNGNSDRAVATTTVRPATNGLFSIGQDWDPPGLTSDFFKGNITDVRIWNYARSQQEILDAMNAELRGDESGLVGYWKLNEGKGSIANDSSIYGNDGRVLGTSTWESGRRIATLRPDGKFGRAVAVENATTNMIGNNLFQNGQVNGAIGLTSWGGNVSAAKYSSVMPIGLPTGLSVEMTSITEGTGGSYFDHNQGITLVDGQKYTYSFYAKALTEATIKGYIMCLNRISDNTYINQPDFVISTEWKRYSFTFTVPVDGGGNYQVRHIIYAQNTIWITGLQLENREWATSFVNGTRELGFLAYPASVINLTQGTVSFWHKPEFPHTLNTTQLVSPMLFQAGNYYGNSSFSIWNYANNLNLYVKGPTASGWSGNVSLLSGNAFPVNVWTMITVTWNGTVWKIYKDGAYVGTVTSTEALGSLAGNLIYVGGWSGVAGAMCNGLLTELRIEKTVVTDDEIMAWYQSNSPFYNYLDYTGVTY